MNCKYCGTGISENDKNCSKCGAPNENYQSKEKKDHYERPKIQPTEKYWG
jgi:hypothetical protein